MPKLRKWTISIQWIVLSFLFFVFSGPSCAHKVSKTPFSVSSSSSSRRVAQSEADPRASEGSFVEYRNCLESRRRFPTLFSNDFIECDDDYILYESAVSSSKPMTDKVRIGSFNIIRIGQSQTRFKRNDFVAGIMNQWDLVTVVEIMNTGQEHIAFNKKLDDIYETSNTEQKKTLETSYEMPRYLMILAELRKLDPSWSLIMSPRATGETVASYEYVGFFYRKGFITNNKSSFCGQKRGCLAPVDIARYGNLISRSPFVARFEIGKLQFNAVGIHTRFRVPAEDCQMASGSSSSTVKKKDCVDYTGEERQWVSDIKELTKRTKINGEDARFLELRVSRESLVSATEEFLMMGDFNLEFKANNRKLWDFALGHDKVYVHEKTSISPVTGLSKQYDHFIVKPGPQLSRCDVQSAKSFNFMLDLTHPTTAIPALFPLAEFLKLRKNRQKALSEYVSALSQDRVVTSCGESVCEYSPRYTDVERDYMICLYERNVLGGAMKDCRALSKLGEEERRDDPEESVNQSRTKPYQVYHEIISDHIPIYMECAI